MTQHPLLVSRGHKPRRGTVYVCEPCGKEFYRQKSSQTAKHPVCSYKCYGEKQRKRVQLKCSHCFNVYEVPQSAYKWAQIRGSPSKFCSKACMSSGLVGDKSPLWIKDRAKVKCRPNGNKDHKLWRELVFERDNYTCQFCHVRGGYLEADHIKPWAYFPALRFDLTNGRTLCRACHNTTKISAKHMKELYGTSLETN